MKKYVHGPGLDEPLAVDKGGVLYYYHADGLGSVVALTSSTEATVEGYTYETFGKFQRFGNAVMNTYGFTGREYDAETGLYYYRARYYDPDTGRFISKDPIGFAGGDANLYNYVLGDPVNWGDPTGLAVSDILPAIQIAFGKAGKAIYDIALNGPPEARVALGLAAVTTVAPLAGSTAIFTVPALVPVAYQLAPYSPQMIDSIYGLVTQTGPPQGFWGGISSGALNSASYIYGKIQDYLAAKSPSVCGNR